MPTLYNVTLKEDALPEKLEEAKAACQENGGTIQHEYSLIKGFTVNLPSTSTFGQSDADLQLLEHINFEKDGPVGTH